MSENKLFKVKTLFAWQDIETEAMRKFYGDLLYIVWQKDKAIINLKKKEDGEIVDDNSGKPNFYNYNYCLSLSEQTFEDVEILDLFIPAKGTDTIVGERKKSEFEIILEDIKKNQIFSGLDNYLKPELIIKGFRNLLMDSAIIDFKFNYVRQYSTIALPAGFDKKDYELSVKGLTVGSVLWLYYYERMGIFKILGALMDDYNYRGKFPISGKRDLSYQPLMDSICTLYRLGIGSNIRDRICVYQRVLGVSIESQSDIQSERNDPFMKLFNKLLNHMLDFYKAKQLAQAIQSAGTGPLTDNVRSSVATQTSIRDTMQVLQQQFEKLEYGRNQINTMLGISLVYSTICLLKLLKSEIGIPAQYDSPEEYIPAAYDILVLKRQPTFSENNRYTIYDNCASYGYRLLTDIQLANMQNFRVSATNSALDIWLNDVEGWVEGYVNAYKSIPEPKTAVL